MAALTAKLIKAKCNENNENGPRKAWNHRNNVMAKSKKLIAAFMMVDTDGLFLLFLSLSVFVISSAPAGLNEMSAGVGFLYSEIFKNSPFKKIVFFFRFFD